MYKITDVEQCDISYANGTSLSNHIELTYDQIRNCFGEPQISDGDPYAKTNSEWVIRIEYQDEETGYDDWKFAYVTIYNWKTGATPTEPYLWHIGARGYVDSDLILAAMKFAKKKGEIC